ncbi:ABC-2 type transport system permease protein [Granulicatella balaenopterae]|uniref:ABC-2 type transport system permease protein n=1 Tax=Granulicatella balaenopterae TaxID=137733 RepID=A0A1H9IYS7_9LACT|nr:hypothetical protein [Granulicatella balaenopterae]SEQ79672.1 ABC-2 type transport system permease protein [Granulicatella balaenopterae]
MRNNIIRQIIRMNLIYSAPPGVIEKQRKKMAKVPGLVIDIPKAIMKQHIWSALLFTLTYGVILGMNQMVSQPGYFSRMAGMFSLLAILQGITAMYNVFYDSNDITSYQPYPVKESEIFLAKGVAVIFPVAMFLLPLLTFFVILPFRAPVANSLVSLVISLICFVLLFMIIACMVTVIVYFLTKSSIFRKYKQVISGIFIAICGLGVAAALIFINRSSTPTTEVTTTDVSGIPMFESLYWMIVEPLNMTTVTTLLLMFALLSIFGVIIKFLVLPNFYQDVLKTSEVAVRKRVKKSKKPMSLRKQLIHYNFGLIQNGSLLASVLLFPIIYPLIIIVTAALKLSDVFWFPEIFSYSEYSLTFFILGALLTKLSGLFGNLTSLIISLDRENFYFIKSLPFDMKYYLKVKFYFALIIQQVPILLLLIGTTLFINYPRALILPLFLGWFMIALFDGMRGFVHDIRYIHFGWGNVMDLMQRGTSNLVKAFIMFGYIIGTGIAIAFSIGLAKGAPEFAYIILAISVVGLALFEHIYYQTKFKPTIEKFLND